MQDSRPIAPFRPVPKTGVIYVMTEAARAGYTPTDPAWANLGQGAPETGPLAGAPARIQSVDLTHDDHEYAPVDGLPELRDAVAALYNARYRVGKASQYTRDNVAISPGGRSALTRLVATLGRSNVGHFLPDYTAYEELLGAFGTFVSIPITLSPDRQYQFSPNQLENEILDRGLSAVLLSNPCNPTGRLIHDDRLRGWVATARELACTLIFDEFYAHYAYVGDGLTVSAAEMVDDVDRDPVVIVDGLTKNWRYPGWRVCWTVGPREIIDKVGSAGSFLDGGCARPMQKASVPLLARDVADAEAAAIQRTFRHKRQLLLEGLEDLGIIVDASPQGGFYCWGDLSRLPPGLDTGMGLFRRALDHKVIVVPGEFFDINPGRRRRPERPGRFQRFARFSFGPSVDTLERGLEGLRRAIG
ncbi:MAG: pyridoxal phosphate-dependent aminotransferase [Alphaproteobacteria bacterium]|nr:pyridoxal phosphate-dependent aminotransferase [Alphaproteobacteria bacterium]